MKSGTNHEINHSGTNYCRRLIVGLLMAGFLTTLAAPALAQPGWRPGPGRPPYGPPPSHHHHHGPSDFDKTMRIVGAVGAVAAVAGGYSPYGYYRQPRPVVVVPSQPTVVIEKTAPIVIEKPVVVERPVVIERPVPTLVSPNDYSYKMGAAFIFQKMQIPGYKFTGARLITNPVEGSPLQTLGLVKGDVITRLDNDPAVSIAALDRHEKATLIRYIKSGTQKVQLGKIYIPTDDDLTPNEEDTYYAP